MHGVVIIGKPIYVCENHEKAFYYWCKAKKNMCIGDAFFLVTLDAHLDLMGWGLQSDFRKEINRLGLGDLDRMKELATRPRAGRQDIITYRQSLAAMEAGLVGDVLLISPQIPFFEIYEDLSKRKHRIFHCVHPSRLRDLLTKNKALRKSIGYDGRADSNLILDIDLDFFTHLDKHEIPHVITEEELREIFSGDSILWWIYEKAKSITISLEPFWCGGMDNSERILKLLKTYFQECETASKNQIPES